MVFAAARLLALLLVLAPGALAAEPAAGARALLASYHEDLVRLERACELLVAPLLERAEPESP